MHLQTVMDHLVQGMELLDVLAEDSSTYSVETRKEMVTKEKEDVFVVVMVLHLMMLQDQAMGLLLMMHLAILHHLTQLQATVHHHMKLQATLLHHMKLQATLLHLMKLQATLLHLMMHQATLLHHMMHPATVLQVTLHHHMKHQHLHHLIQLQSLVMEHLDVHAEDSFLILHQMVSRRMVDIRERKVAHVQDIQLQFPTVLHQQDMDLPAETEELSTSLVEIKKRDMEEKECLTVDMELLVMMLHLAMMPLFRAMVHL